MGALVRSDSRQPAVKQEAAVKGRQYLTFTVGGESFGIAIASIKEIIHDRAFSGPDLSAVRVLCVVETTGHDHVMALHRALDAAGVRRIG